MKIKIISDGTPYGTEVVNAETGDPIQYVKRVQWRMDAELGSVAVITVVNVQLELTVDAAIQVAPANRPLAFLEGDA